ncbi:unnamed protein product [Trypanosoma congolense IL3000]|uniref:WGS project CAEQ00000000 data, annotated contig 1068 n=1 Tax=Trypanosoma congolense (strain IL3000) TaxID=1068625 RepID=F9W3K4_TRYCI|nr:unnamed protein product [Trypanosoma congolense IL3000]
MVNSLLNRTKLKKYPGLVKYRTAVIESFGNETNRLKKLKVPPIAFRQDQSFQGVPTVVYSLSVWLLEGKSVELMYKTQAVKLCISLIWTVFVTNRGLAADEGINIPAFSILCGLGQFAAAISKHKPENILDGLADWDRVTRVLRTIEKFRDEANASSGQLVELRLEDGLKVSLKGGQCARQALRVLSALGSRVLGLQGKVSKFKEDAQRALSSAKSTSPLALGASGETTLKTAGTPLANAGTLGNRNAACKDPDGTSAKGKAGSSIPHDMLCLCASKTGSTQALCGVASTGDWAGGSFSTAAADWGTLATQCESIQSERMPTANELAAALGSFRNALGAGTKVSGQTAASKAHWILGEIKANGDCDGDTNGGCINYLKKSATCSKGGDCPLGEIGWFNNLEAVRQRLQGAEAAGASANRTSKLAESILLQAESMLIDANASEAIGACIRPGTHQSTAPQDTPSAATNPPASIQTVQSLSEGIYRGMEIKLIAFISFIF